MIEQTGFALAVQAFALSRAQLRALLRAGVITPEDFRRELDSTILTLRDIFARHDDRLAVELVEAALGELLSEV
ncbi:MAG TPA: hypothetical protein VNT60_11585 [Deinococcales bacterium]|nr:hypothetical protein [Deinococcales bacterium]